MLILTHNHIFEAATCALVFHNTGRFVHLYFEDAVSRLIVKASEADMAALTGKFLKERLFGLH